MRQSNDCFEKHKIGCSVVVLFHNLVHSLLLNQICHFNFMGTRRFMCSVYCSRVTRE